MAKRIQAAANTPLSRTKLECYLESGGLPLRDISEREMGALGHTTGGRGGWRREKGEGASQRCPEGRAASQGCALRHAPKVRGQISALTVAVAYLYLREQASSFKR